MKTQFLPKTKRQFSSYAVYQIFKSDHDNNSVMWLLYQTLFRIRFLWTTCVHASG